MLANNEPYENVMLIAEISMHYGVTSTPDLNTIMVETNIYAGRGEEPLILYLHVEGQDQLTIEDGCRVLEIMGYRGADPNERRRLEAVLRLNGIRLDGDMLVVECNWNDAVEKLQRMIDSLSGILRTEKIDDWWH